MYKPSGGGFLPNTRETSSLPVENLTWQREPCNRDPRPDRMDRDRVGAGKRYWSGDWSSNMTSFQGITSGSSLSGNGFVPRSKPRFHGHYSGFFAESKRNGRSILGTGPVDTDLVHRGHRDSNPSGTFPTASFSGGAGVGCRVSDIEERDNGDQFLSSGDVKEGFDHPLPLHTSQVHSDSPSLRNRERTRSLGSRNWEYSSRIGRDYVTSPHGNAGLYSSSRRSILPHLDSGKDWDAGDKRSEVGRFERYGNGNRDGPRADHEGNNKDTDFPHGWRRERGNSGVIARDSSFTACSRSSGELGGTSVGSAYNSLHASILSANQDLDQPSPSKRPRLGWGQGLAKYEKKVDVSSSVEKSDMKRDGEGDSRSIVENTEKKRGVGQGVLIVPGWKHEHKQQHTGNLIDVHQMRGENKMKTVLIREHGEQEVNGEDASLYPLLRDSLRKREKDERNPARAQKLQVLERRPVSPIEIKEKDKIIRGRDKRSAVINYNVELELHGQNLASPFLPEDRRKDDESVSGVLQELIFVEGQDQNLMPSVPVEEPETRLGEVAKNSAFIEKDEGVLGGIYQNASLLEPLHNENHDLSIFSTEAETRGDISSTSASLVECEIGLRGIEANLLLSPTTHLEMNTDDRDVVSTPEVFPEVSSIRFEKHNSPCSRVTDDCLPVSATLVIAESVALPASSPIHISTRNFSANHLDDEQDITDMVIDERPLEAAEVLEEPGKNVYTEFKIALKEVLVEDPEASSLLARELKTNLRVPEAVSAVVGTQPTFAEVATSPDPSLSQVCEQVVATSKSDSTLLESEPASDGSLVTETSTAYTCISVNLNDVDHAVRLDSASQTKKSILETVGKVEAEIDLVEKEIAQISLRLSSDVSSETIVTHRAGVSTLGSPSTVPEYEDVPILMEEDRTESVPCSVDTEVVCSLTAVSTRFKKSPIHSTRDVSSMPALLLRESSMTQMSGKEVLELLPGGLQFKSASFNKDCDTEGFRDALSARSGSFSPNCGMEESEYARNQFGNEVAIGGSSQQERYQMMIESVLMENKEKARLAGAIFAHLLPENFTGTINQQYHSPIEAPVWHHNVERHKNVHGRLLEKIAGRRHSIKFKERVLTLRYRALKEAWKREKKGLSTRRNRLKTVSRWDSEGRSGHVPPSQRSYLRLRPLSLGRLDAESDAAQIMKILMKNPQMETLRPTLKMPAMILDQKESAVRRFVSRNAIVEDPIALEMERKTINPWSAEERKIFAEKFVVYNKNFKEIALYLQYKTTADCVQYYYRNQKLEEFGKSQHGIHFKNRWDYTKSSSIFLMPTSTRIKRSHEANCARIETLNVGSMKMNLSQSRSQLQVSEHVDPSSDPFIMSSIVEIPKFVLQDSKVLEVVLSSEAIIESATSSLISTPCSVSSTAAPLTDQCKERDFVKERIKTGPSTTRISHSEQHPAGLKGTRSTYLRRMSSGAAAQENSQWTDMERELFTSAVATFGKDFRVIASHVGTKNQSQCKAFFSKTRKRLRLDELVEQFQATEAAAMLVQSFRHNAVFAQEMKLNSTSEMDASAGDIAEDLMDTVAAVSTLESLKEQSKFLENDLSDLSLVADAAAVMAEIAPMMPEFSTLELFSSDKSRTSNQGLSCGLVKGTQSNFTVPFTLLRKEEDEDSEATKSDGSYLVGAEAETDIVVDQAAAALVGMSEMLVDRSGFKRSVHGSKFQSKSSSTSMISRSQSARLPISSPSSLCLTSGRTARHAKERVNALISCRPTKDAAQDMHDAHIGRKGRETAGGEPKPRREPTSWTQEEKEKFAVILQEHGKDWALLHENLPSKSLTQIKTYFQNSKARSRLPASDKLLTVVRHDSANCKRNADEFGSARRAVEFAHMKQKVQANVASELDNGSPKADIVLGSASVSGAPTAGGDILACAGGFSREPADQDSSVNGMQHSDCQIISLNTYAQDGHEVFRPGPKPLLPSSSITCPHNPGGFELLLSGLGPSKLVGPDLQTLPFDVAPQAGASAVIHQVAQQVRQMLQQQQHLQKQLNFLQAALPPQLLPQHQVTQQTLQAVRPLEEKLHLVVQQLQQQYELRGRRQAPGQEDEGHALMGHYQLQQVTPSRGNLQAQPIRGVVSKPLVDLATSPSSCIFPNQAKSQNEDIHLLQQHNSLSLGMGTIPTLTSGNTIGVQENHSKTFDLQDMDSDADCEAFGSRLMVTEDSHQRMSMVHSISSGQLQHTVQSTLSNDSEEAKPWDVKLFGQSLLSKPPLFPSSLPCLAGCSIQEFLNPNTSAPMPTMTFSTDSVPPAFGRVVTSSIIAEGQEHPTSWPGKYGAWSTLRNFQLSGATELARKVPDSEIAHEAVISPAAQSGDKALVLAPRPAFQGDDDHLGSE